MNKIIQRKFSGYALNLPEDFKLRTVDIRTGEINELNDDYFGVEYYMRVSFLNFFDDWK